MCVWKSNPMIWRCEFQNSEGLFSDSKTVVSKPLKMAFNKNPWMVESIESFSFYCCPECVFRSKEETFFQAHALQNHSQSTSLFHNYGGDHVILTGCQMTNLVSNFECLFWFFSADIKISVYRVGRISSIWRWQMGTNLVDVMH